jgi:hypothetical protein
MPKYTIGGQTVNSPVPLSEDDLLELSQQLGGGVPQPQPTAVAPTDVPAVAAPQPTAQPQATPQKRSVVDELGRQIGLTGRAAYEAFTSPALAVLEAGRGAYNLGAQALGSESRIPSFAQAQSQMLGQVLPTPETTTERAVQAGTQAMASTAGLAKLAPSVPALASDMARQIPSAAVAGLVSQPVAEKVKDITGSDLAALVAGVGFGTVGAATTGKVLSATAPGKAPLFTMEEVKKRASDSYNKMDSQGVSIQPKSTLKLVDDIKVALDTEGRMIPATDQANSVNATLAQVTKIINQQPQGVSFTALEKIRSTLNDLRMSSDADISRLGGLAVSKVDDYISNLSGKDILAGKAGLDAAVKNVMSARKDWRNASRASVLDDALNVAEVKKLDPKASESELIRRGFINIAANKDKMNLFNKTEQNIIKSVAQGGTLDPVLTLAAQFSPLRSKLAAAGGAYALTQAPVATTAVAGTGLTADLLQGALRRRAAQQAVKQIASGAQAPAPNLGYVGLLTGGLNPPGQ